MMKKFFLRCFFAMVFFTLFPIAYAQTSLDLVHLLDSIHSMQADFIQTVYDNRGKTIQHAYGTMALQRPGKFRWQVKKPVPQLIIANDSRLWVYDPDLEQVTVRSLKQSADEAPALLLSHVDTTIDKDYVVKSLQKNTPHWQWFDLHPRSADNMFASIQLGFINGQIQEMILKDHLGHTTRVQFENIKLNNPISSKAFVFKAASNVDVIDETRKR